MFDYVHCVQNSNHFLSCYNIAKPIQIIVKKLKNWKNLKKSNIFGSEPKPID